MNVTVRPAKHKGLFTQSGASAQRPRRQSLRTSLFGETKVQSMAAVRANLNFYQSAVISSFCECSRPALRSNGLPLGYSTDFSTASTAQDYYRWQVVTF